ncbi:MAG: peptidoglycan bridge formation glycyltransferase FemA/FemB family protein [Chloroflexota bacterium]|nr:peptidoglycan bridge formation glycyltransferase FemA/FemB family protein [Chloroflexota bacterium]
MLNVTNDLRRIDNPDTRAWNDFVRARGGHILQSTAWAELKSRFGWSAQRVALARGNEFVAGAQILYRQLPLGLRFAYVPRGPVADPQDRATFTALVDALCNAARTRGAFVLKVELNEREDSASNLRSAICHLPSANPIQPRTTIHVDLTRDLDAILAQMKPKWRYNIRLAERKGVTVRAGNADDIATFYRLLQVTGARDAFAIHSLDYYRAAFDLFTAQNAARLFVAEYAGEPLAAIFVTAFGAEAIYLYGASGNAHRERMPNHALHWHAMQWAKSRGCARYDLWGIADTAWAEAPVIENVEAQRDASLPHGLYQFKQGFGGEVVRYAGAFDMVFSRWRYALYTRAIATRRGAMG